MDNSRDHDLAALHERFTNPNLSDEARKRAYNAYQDIQAQVKDKVLTALRYRLVRAHRADDQTEIGKLESLIKEHGRKHRRVLHHG
jgi:hypothetical protein